MLNNSNRSPAHREQSLSGRGIGYNQSFRISTSRRTTLHGIVYRAHSEYNYTRPLSRSVFSRMSPTRVTSPSISDLPPSILSRDPIFHSPTENATRAIFPRGIARPSTQVSQQERCGSAIGNSPVLSSRPAIPAASRTAAQGRTAGRFTIGEYSLVNHLNLEVPQGDIETTAPNSSHSAHSPRQRRLPVYIREMAREVCSGLIRPITAYMSAPSPSNVRMTVYDNWQDLLESGSLDGSVAHLPSDDGSDENESGYEADEESEPDQTLTSVNANGDDDDIKRTLGMKLRSQTVRLGKGVKKAVKKILGFLKNVVRGRRVMDDDLER